MILVILVFIGQFLHKIFKTAKHSLVSGEEKEDVTTVKYRLIQKNVKVFHFSKNILQLWLKQSNSKEYFKDITWRFLKKNFDDYSRTQNHEKNPKNLENFWKKCDTSSIEIYAYIWEKRLWT